MKPIIFGASVQGASHIRSETECQDSYKRIECADGTVIMAVADGHGSQSCPYSRIGSKVAVNVFCSIMSEYVNGYAGNSELLITFLNREGDTKVAQAIDAEWKRRIREVHRKNKRDFPTDENGNKNLQKVYAQYGTTLLGLVLTDTFLFAFQIGDGDIEFISGNEIDQVVKSEKILGVETHSLSKMDAWKKAVTVVQRLDFAGKLPAMFLMSTDGFANSYKNETEFAKTCREYFDMVNHHGAKAVDDNLKEWLSETSEMGCGDDITVLMAYYAADVLDASAESAAGETVTPDESIIDDEECTDQKETTPSSECEVSRNE